MCALLLGSPIQWRITGVQFEILLPGRSRSPSVQRHAHVRSVSRGTFDPDLNSVARSARRASSRRAAVLFERWDRHVLDSPPSAFVGEPRSAAVGPGDPHVPGGTSNCKRPPETNPVSKWSLPFSLMTNGPQPPPSGRQPHCHHRRPEHEDTPHLWRYAGRSRFVPDESCRRIRGYPPPRSFGIMGLRRKILQILMSNKLTANIEAKRLASLSYRFPARV